MTAEARPPRPPWREFRAAMESCGFRPSRRFGQNFLLDENTVRAIVADADLPEGARVLEVGTGCGFLTIHLGHAGLQVLTAEIDSRLAQIAAPFLDPYPNVRLFLGDALESKHGLHPEIVSFAEHGPWHVVANLPYGISGPFLAILAGLDRPPESITVLVQKEMAQRALGRPGHSDYGSLAISLAWTYSGTLLRDVGGASFWPRPKVGSSVLRLVRRDGAPGAVERREAQARVRQLFTRRRQTFVRVMADLGADRGALVSAMEEAGIPPQSRAEALPPELLMDWVLGPLWPAD